MPSLRGQVLAGELYAPGALAALEGRDGTRPAPFAASSSCGRDCETFFDGFVLHRRQRIAIRWQTPVDRGAVDHYELVLDGRHYRLPPNARSFSRTLGTASEHAWSLVAHDRAGNAQRASNPASAP
jgi:hypothetical protein